MKRLIVDIDGTICTQEKDYKDAKPIKERIAHINSLFDAGWEVVYFTARGTETGIDWTNTTMKQFEEWGVDWTDLIFGKPAGDWYIDDKAFTVKQLENHMKLSKQYNYKPHIPMDAHK